MQMNGFWENLALDLLETNLNGHSLNADSVRKLFAKNPDALPDIDFNGEEVADLDKALYGGRPQIIEIREAKPTEIYHCRACVRSFKRGDNFRRHLNSALHTRRQRAMEISAREAQMKEDSPEPESPKPELSSH